MPRKITTEKCIEKFKLIHGSKYDYSMVEYKKSTDKIIIICLLHGKFLQRYTDHCCGYGCPMCGSILVQEKRKITMQKIGDTGKTRFEEAMEKSKITKRKMKENGNTYAAQKSAETKKRKILDNGMSQMDFIIQNLTESKRKNYQYPINHSIQRLFEYRKNVDALTKINIKLYGHLINYDPILNTPTKFHIDHIISVWDGYRQEISEEKISHICNLRFIPAKINLKKNRKSDISYQTLLELINQFNNSIR